MMMVKIIVQDLTSTYSLSFSLSASLPFSTSTSRSKKGSLEKLLSGLQQEVDSQHAELEVLRGSSLEVQRQRDLLRQQREDLETQLARQRTEALRGYSMSTQNDRYITHILSPVIVFKLCLFRVQISNTCHSPAGKAPR